MERCQRCGGQGQIQSLTYQEMADIVEEAVAQAKKTGYPVVVKTQVGARGKAGVVKLANDADEVRTILGMEETWTVCPECNGKPPEAYEVEEIVEQARAAALKLAGNLDSPVSHELPPDPRNLPLPPANVLWDCMELAAVIATSWVNPPWINQWKAAHLPTVEWLEEHGTPYLPPEPEEG